MFRLVRVFRVFKLSKHNKDIETSFGALYESRAIFRLMLFLLCILCIVFASFAFNFEEGGKDPWGGPTAFTCIPAAMWWCIVTVTSCCLVCLWWCVVPVPSMLCLGVVVYSHGITWLVL